MNTIMCSVSRTLYNQRANPVYRRCFWSWLNPIFNLVDEARIKEIGPDRACAEWLVKNGAAVRFKGSSALMKDYNKLTVLTGKSFYIVEIDGEDSSISHYGFEYFRGCKHIEKIALRKCAYIDNKALRMFAFLSDSLKHLTIRSCGNVTDKGLMSLTSLTNLQKLVLFDLPGVEDKEKCIQHLTEHLKDCTVEYLTS